MENQISNNFVWLWKSATVDLGNNKYMIIMYYYHTDTEDKSKSFYKCNIRIDSKENWEALRLNILNNNPAEKFKNSMIGLSDDFEIYYARHIFTKADMYKWIGNKFSPVKIQSKDKFFSESFLPSVKFPFLRTYNINGQNVDITEIDKIPEGQWFSTFKEKKPRKSYGRVIH